MEKLVLAFILAVATTATAAPARTFTGIITDTMCGIDHKPMNVSPEPRCVTECVKHGKDVKYALVGDGKTYLLSDQETPAIFAGKRVKVTGVYYAKTNILAVQQIEAVK